MRFRQLKYFCKIVESGSFSRAAAAIYVAQPALSQQIADLEAQLGVELLHRTPRGVRATAAGEILYREATALLKSLDQIPNLIRSGEGGVQGPVSLGISTIIGPHIAGAAAAACKESLPKVSLKLAASDSVSLRNRVEAGQLDMAIILEHELQRTAPSLSRSPLYRQRLYFTANKALDSSVASLSQLAGMPLVLPSLPNSTRFAVDHALASTGLSLTIATEIDDFPGSLMAVRAGLGGTVIPTGTLAHVGGVDLPAPVPIEPALYVTATLVADKTAPLTQAGNAVRALLVPLIKDYLDVEQILGTEWIAPD
jgi:LysR family transcriptional regulator, nitrogen assimilation regulatory protein